MTPYSYPKISIVTPSYNQGIFLEATISSVLGQNYPNLEYIIIDGGSTDNSVDIIKKYDHQLTYWVSEKDRGQTEAINKGLRRTTGEIVAWINSDDVYEPSTFATVAEFFCDRPDVDMIFGDANIIDHEGHFLFHKKALPFDRLMGICIGFGLLITQPTVFWRRSIFDRVGYLDETFDFDMDGEFWARIAADCRVEHISQRFALQRYHDQAKTVVNFGQRQAKHKNEMVVEQQRAYARHPLSRFLPYPLFQHLAPLYRIRRIVQRLIRGHYFSGYGQRV